MTHLSIYRLWTSDGFKTLQLDLPEFVDDLRLARKVFIVVPKCIQYNVVHNSPGQSPLQRTHSYSMIFASHSDKKYVAFSSPVPG